MEEETQDLHFTFSSTFLFSPLSLLCLLALAIIVATVAINGRGRPRGSRACAACNYQRRKCKENCVFAPHFPGDQPQAFHNALRLFGVANMGHMLAQVPEDQKEDCMASIKYEANVRAASPVHGCLGVTRRLENELRETFYELQHVMLTIESIKSQISLSVPSGGTPRSAFQINEGSGNSGFEFLTANGNTGARQDPNLNDINNMINQPRFALPINDGNGTSGFEFLTANGNTGAHQDPDSNAINNIINQPRFESPLPNFNHCSGSSRFEFLAAIANRGAHQDLNANVNSNMINQPRFEFPITNVNECGESSGFEFPTASVNGCGGSSGFEFSIATGNARADQYPNPNGINSMITQPKCGEVSGFEFPMVNDNARADQYPDANTIACSNINSLSNNREADQDPDVNQLAVQELQNIALIPKESCMNKIDGTLIGV